ncbi:MAG: hypothetical protein ABDK94_00085 [Atribacterota bacterium]
MMEKHVLFLSNGYGEDSFLQLIATAFIEEAKRQKIPVRLSFMPLVGEGKLLQDLCRQHPQQCSLLKSFLPLPYGGVYLGNVFQRLGRLIFDVLSGGAKNTLQSIYHLARIRRTVDMVVVIGDVFLLLLSFISLRKKAYLFACAHTALLHTKGKPYERLGKFNAHLLHHLVQKIYTRDHPTALWLQSLGINACYLGFVGPLLPKKNPKSQTILFLPGHRGDWKENFRFLVTTILHTRSLFPPYLPHFVFPPEPSTLEIESLVREIGAIPSTSSFSLEGLSVTWSQGDYFTRLGDTALVVGFAGTALEHAAHLGIPCLEPYATRAIQVNRYFLEKRQKLLLREALIQGENTPEKTASILKETITNLPQMQKKAEDFSKRIWQNQRNGALYIAQDLLSILCTLPPLQDIEPVRVDSGNGIR